MRFLHLADLHLGKRIHGYDLLEDQRHFLFRVALKTCEEKDTSILLLSGDIFDQSAPSGDAMSLLDDFLSECADRGIRVLMIPGNHDSPERLSYASAFFAKRGIYIVSDPAQAKKPIMIDGDAFFLIPFLRQADLFRLGEPCSRENDFATNFALFLDSLPLIQGGHNIVLAHQTVLDVEGHEPTRSDSELPSIGTSANLPLKPFMRFDYVALGHIHNKYPILSERIRYAGAPLKYHVNECAQRKTMNLVELNGKDIHVEEIPIVPLRDVKKIRGSFDELMSHEDEEHYIYAELTDLRPIDNVSGKLKGKYPYLLGSLYVSLEKKESDKGPIDVKTIGKGPLDEDFAKFYETMTGKALSSFQKKEIQEIAQAVQGEKQ